MNIIIKIVIAIVVLSIVIAASICLHADEPTSKPIRDENNNTDDVKEKPGFEAVFAIAGLLAIAYLTLRQRE